MQRHSIYGAAYRLCREWVSLGGGVDPLAKDGYIKLFPTDGIDLGEGVEEMVVGIKQVQMEQVCVFIPHVPHPTPITPFH